MPALTSAASFDKAAQSIDAASSSVGAQFAADVQVQVLAELRVISWLLNIGLNVNEDLDRLRDNESVVRY